MTFRFSSTGQNIAEVLFFHFLNEKIFRWINKININALTEILEILEENP